LALLTSEVSRLASAQHGVLTSEQLLAKGCTLHQIRSAVDRGELIRRHTDVFRVAAAPATWEQRTLVATLAGGSGALASHRSAARLWGLDGSTQGRPEIVTPRHLRSWAPHLGRIHESTDLHLAEPTELQCIPCTGIVRTLVDLGAVVPIESLQQAADDAVRRSLCTWDDLLHALAMHSRRGRRGVGPLRAVLEESYGKSVPDSRFNRLVERLLAASGLEPAAEYEVRDATGLLIARVDLAYPDLKIAIELDSKRHHLTSQAFEKDRTRQNQLELLGWIVLRYTWRQYVDSPTLLIAEVRAAVDSRAAHTA
jgi:very-short-patch-repair endonuclease